MLSMDSIGLVAQPQFYLNPYGYADKLQLPEARLLSITQDQFSQGDTIPYASLGHLIGRDRSGQATSYLQLDNHSTKQSESYSEKYTYLQGNRPLRQIHIGTTYADTVMYSYNRAGKLASIRHHLVAGTLDTSWTIRFLQDNYGRTIVVENAVYGDRSIMENHVRRLAEKPHGVAPYFITGTFTYSYNAKGKLTGRDFLDAKNGNVFCRDTLIYEQAIMGQNAVYIRHLLKIMGQNQWWPVDAQLIDTLNGLVLRYWNFKDRTATAITYTLNEMRSMILSVDSSKSEVRTTYFYYSGARLDSVLIYSGPFPVQPGTAVLIESCYYGYDNHETLLTFTRRRYNSSRKKSRKKKSQPAVLFEERWRFSAR